MTKHMMMILVLFILALGGSGCASQSGSDFVSDAFRRGAQLEQQGQYFRAAEAYLIVLRSQPGNRKARADLRASSTRRLRRSCIWPQEWRPS